MGQVEQALVGLQETAKSQGDKEQHKVREEELTRKSGMAGPQVGGRKVGGSDATV